MVSLERGTGGGAEERGTQENICFLYPQQKWQHVQAESERTTGLPEWAQAPIPGLVSPGDGKGSSLQHKTRAPPQWPTRPSLLWLLALLILHFISLFLTPTTCFSHSGLQDCSKHMPIPRPDMSFQMTLGSPFLYQIPVQASS